MRPLFNLTREIGQAQPPAVPIELLRQHLAMVSGNDSTTCPKSSRRAIFDLGAVADRHDDGSRGGILG